MIAITHLHVNMLAYILKEDCFSGQTDTLY